MTTFTVYVTGTPAPQGSKRHVGNGRLIESAAGLSEWRAHVADRVRDTARILDFDGYGRDDPVDVWVMFRLHRPSTIRRAYVTVRPDVDKLARAVLDALTMSGVIVDDSQVVRLATAKRYVVDGEVPGAVILIRPSKGQGK